MADKKISSIFGTEAKNVITDALFFTEPAPNQLQEVMDMLEKAFNKNQLWIMCQSFRSLFHSRASVLLKLRNGGKRPCTEMSPIFLQGSTKSELSRVMAMMLCEPNNLQLYIDHLAEEERELWRRVLTNVYVSEGEAKNILKTNDIISEERISYYRVSKFAVANLSLLSLTQGLSAMASRYGYRARASFVTVHPRLFPYFFQAFFPAAYEQEIGRTQLPDSGLLVCNYEAESVSKYMLVSSLIQAGELGLRTKGISMSDVKRVAKKVGLEEFPLEVGLQSTLRSRYYLGTLAAGVSCFAGKKQSTKKYERALHTIFKDCTKTLQDYLLPLLLPHIKGLRQRLIEFNALGIMVNLLLESLREEPDAWLSFSDVLMRSFSSSESQHRLVSYPALVFDPNSQTDNVELVNEFSGKAFSADSFVMEFGYTVLQAMGFLLCSVGMAELALSSSHRPESPFARAEYLRLTGLGRFALGIVQEYEPPHIDQQAYFELDPERLIIRSLAEPNPYAQLLSDTSVPISKSRFETSASSFLAHCKSRDDVENKISIFRQFISSELPPLWKHFFDTLLQHCNPLKTDTAAYKHYRLSPDNSDLIRLITTDDQLRKLIIRAEGYLILVRQEDIRHFEDLLKKHGYLL